MSRLPEDLLKQLQEIFTRFDIDGSLTHLEVAALLRSLDLKPTGDQIHKLFNNMDSDASGTVDFLRFKSFDRDNSGFITPAELAKSMTKMGQPLTYCELSEMVRDANTEDVLLILCFDLLVEFLESKMEPMDIVGKTKEDYRKIELLDAFAVVVLIIDTATMTKIIKEMLPPDVRVARDTQDLLIECCVATMTKIIKEMLPPDVRVARDTQDLLIECCVEFINLISSESNEVCGREDRRTITPEHVLKALEVLGFGDYIEEVYDAYEQHKLETVDTVKGGRGIGAEMTEEEALAEQQRMFAEARARMNGVATAPKPPEAESSLNSQLLEPL
ncbi:hypothetical protein L1987_51664 [Smallanthus sonchifolius]|uniref:Uncharacterized protein n=1 Tax=Smallanthus sonchifolius TaxID=185202 RepID=A0ACB9ER02_9ASTR|nr:hypothetical protein L1987_51664 [Smallanthus sonchifolius]